MFGYLDLTSKGVARVCQHQLSFFYMFAKRQALFFMRNNHSHC